MFVIALVRSGEAIGADGAELTWLGTVGAGTEVSLVGRVIGVAFAGVGATASLIFGASVVVGVCGTPGSSS